jgi:DNA uptake protein ComE-like DNA-binding protein
MKKAGLRVLLGILVVLLAASLCMAAAESGSTAAEPAKTTEKKQKKKTFPGQEDLLDINTASADQLKSLPGLTDEDVKKIIAGRPYTRKNELKQKNIISAAAYDGIKKKIVAKKPAKQVK